MLGICKYRYKVIWLVLTVVGRCRQVTLECGDGVSDTVEWRRMARRQISKRTHHPPDTETMPSHKLIDRKENTEITIKTATTRRDRCRWTAKWLVSRPFGGVYIITKLQPHATRSYIVPIAAVAAGETVGSANWFLIFYSILACRRHTSTVSHHLLRYLIFLPSLLCVWHIVGCET